MERRPQARLRGRDLRASQAQPGSLHGFTTFRLTGNTNRPHATSWDTTNHAYTWPIWHKPHTATTLATLLEHPSIRSQTPNPTRLRYLGVTALYGATRTRLKYGDGPLEPGRRIAELVHEFQNSKPATAHRTALKPDVG
ncbi:type I-G CRISPR-associated protein, Cas3-extension family [Streptomyces xanthophaeus]